MAKKRSARGTKGSAIPAQPMCTCLLLCDDVVVSHARDKHTLQGIIGAIGVGGLPALVGPYVAYVRVSNVHLDQKVTVSFDPADGSPPLWEFPVELLNRNDPLAVYTLIGRVTPFPIREAGKYLLTVKHHGVPLTHTVIEVVAPPQAPGGGT